MSQRLKTDWILFFTVLSMVSIGLLMVYSASSITAQMDPRFGSSWHFVVRQCGWAAAALVCMMALKKTSYTKLRSGAVAFSAVAVALILLGAVLVVDPVHHRWLRLSGTPLGVQPSELAKLALVIFLAFFVTWRGRAINNRRYTLIPAALAIGLLLFMVVVADLGTAVVLGLAAAVVFFVAGLEWRYCAIVSAIAALGLLIFIFMQPYRLARVVHFFDPDFKRSARFDKNNVLRARMDRSLATRDPNYQLTQAQIAMGSGGLAGLGPMSGRQKLYLPESHTDFIYAVVGEELGLMGAAALLVGFGLVFWRGMRTALLMRDDFGRYLALGITAVVVVQGLINMSVVLGLMPTKGIPLPMISYGGSSLLSTLAMLGILMNVSEHA
jgi:cell division protein FtsW